MVWQDNLAVFFWCEDRGSFWSISIRQWISWRIRVNFKTSVTWHSWLWEVNTPAIELIMIASNLGKGSNSPFEWSALLPLPDHQQQWTLHQPRKRPHYDAIQVRNFYITLQGQYHGMTCIMRSSTRSKEDQMIIPSTPDTTSRYKFSPIIFTERCHTLELFHRANQGWRNKISRSKDSKFWTLADK